MPRFNIASFILGICVGGILAISILIYAYNGDIKANTIKWQKKMVECGCGAYNEETGEWYAIDTAPAPMAAPIPEPAPYLPEEE